MPSIEHALQAQRAPVVDEEEPDEVTNKLPYILLLGFQGVCNST